MYKISFFVPSEHKEKVKNAMFEAGAGKIGNYDSCSFEVKGEGQFRALKGANPFLGTLEKIEKVEEYKVEMVVIDKKIKEAIKAMKENHPYETVAYDIIKLEDY